MDKYIDQRFERVERALASLIDSITKYTPSTTVANDLAKADKELSDGLNDLQTHQNNHLRIQELRKETADLDAQIKTTVSLLWSTRKEITSTPTTSYPSSGPRYPFTYSDLLDYARRISTNTLPAGGITNGVDLSAPQPETQQPSADQTPVTAASENQPAVTNGATTDPSQQTQPDTSQSFSTALPDHMSAVVNLLDNAVFYPWPGEDKIRSGALDACQQLLDSGVDPKGYDPVERERQRQAEVEEAKQREVLQEEERKRREEERFAQMARERAAAQERERERMQEAGTGGSPIAKTAQKQFQFMSGLDDDEDEE